MLGPLPRLHRSLVATTAVVVFTVLGLWATRALGLGLPLDGLVAGCGVGLLLAFALVHDFSRRATPSARAVRARHRP